MTQEYTLCGLCVTVTPTTFIFTGGEESGAAVGLINYPRFSSENSEKSVIEDHAIALAALLMTRCCQRSCTVVTTGTSGNAVWLQNEAIQAHRVRSMLGNRGC